ncbi:MAG: hypothetical protein E7632_07390 [Ruminococcaceae bacterium]|nr:hypothetical protein [Oscillospiraceae bacterium]
MAVHYSKNHEGLFFIDNDMGELIIHGEGSVRAEDTETWNPDESWKAAVTEITVRDGITEIGGGVLEQFPNVKKLNLPGSLTRMESTDGLKTRLCTNDVLLNAAYGSFGDAFALEHGLRFLPCPIVLGWYRDEEHDESTKLVLRFHEDGSMDILIDIFTVGISAGSSGGATLERPMPEDYHPGCTPEQFAQLFPAVYYDQIMKNPEVEIFLRREATGKEKGKQ